MSSRNCLRSKRERWREALKGRFALNGEAHPYFLITAETSGARKRHLMPMVAAGKVVFEAAVAG
ncbi:MAG: hypothetical protein M3R15_28585 [Acidobacteriota bacterium]|nr:hypothetical protein [Acidobacteriota bacterium]